MRAWLHVWLVLGALLPAAYAALPATASAQGTLPCDLGGPLDPDLLREASPYTQFVRGDDRQINETEGRIAVGGDFTVSTEDPTIGFRTSFGLPPSPDPVLVAGGDITATGSFIQLLTDVPATFGIGTYGGAYNPGIADEGTFVNAPPPFSFSDAFTYLEGLADFLATCPTSAGATVGTFMGNPNTLLLTGTNPAINVFNLNTAQLEAAVSTYLDVPVGSTTLVNLSGPSYSTETAPNADFWIRDPATLGGAFVQVLHCPAAITPPPGCFFNTSAGAIGPQYMPPNVLAVMNHLLWSFPDATSFRKGAVAWAGSILAPAAALQWGPTMAQPGVGLGPFEGQIVLDSIDSGTSDGGLESHASELTGGDLLFQGTLPRPITPPDPPSPPTPQPLLPSPKLAVGKKPLSGRVRAGGKLTFRIIVRGRGPGSAEDVEVCDRVSGKLSFVSASGDWRREGRRICWLIGSLAEGEGVVLKITTRVDAGACGRVKNVAVGSSSNAGSPRGSGSARIDPCGGVGPVTVEGLG